MLEKMRVGNLHPESQYDPDLPFYTRFDIGKHRSKETGIWMSFEHGVYDLTEFIQRHPGGSEKIIMAAGGPIEPFWNMYPFHNTPTIV
jgi:sulfite oxidase